MRTAHQSCGVVPAARLANTASSEPIDLPALTVAAPNFSHRVREIPRPLRQNSTGTRASGRTAVGQFMHYLRSNATACWEDAGFAKHRSTQPASEMAMLYTIAVILLILWLLGFLSGYTIETFKEIHPSTGGLPWSHVLCSSRR